MEALLAPTDLLKAPFCGLSSSPTLGTVIGLLLRVTCQNAHSCKQGTVALLFFVLFNF